MEEYAKEEFFDIDFRDKKLNTWNPDFITTINTANSTKIISGDYNTAFLSDLINRKSCAHCKYAKTERTGDFTLGDFWGIKHYKKSLDDKKGTSCVFINSTKAKNLYEEIEKALKFNKSVPLKIAQKSNKNLKEPVPAHKYRELFLNNLDKKPFEKLLKSCSSFSPDCAILNF